MVLESLIGEKRLRKHPELICALAFIISIGSIFFAENISAEHASVLSIAFITIGLVPLVYNILAKETDEEVLARRSCTTFFARHFDIILIYVWIFIGIILAFSVAYVLTPPEVRSVLFEEQITSFCFISGQCKGSVPYSIGGQFPLAIAGGITGDASAITGNASGTAYSECRDPTTSDVTTCSLFILANNGKVLLLTIALSLLYGAGAIFVIAWNAAILGIFFGEMFLMGQHLTNFGFLQSMLIGHGPPELFSYIFGALAGAVLSAVIARGQFFTHEFSIAVKDVVFLAFLSLFSVLYGAITEAVGILNMPELYFALGFLYLLIIIVMVFLYGKRRTPGKFCY